MRPEFTSIVKAIQRRIDRLFIENYMRNTPTMVDPLCDVINNCNASYGNSEHYIEILHSLLRYDGQPTFLQKNPCEIKLAYLSKLEGFNIPNYLVLALKRKRYETIAQIQTLSPEELLRMPGVGKRGFCSICEAVRLFGDNCRYEEDLVVSIKSSLPQFHNDKRLMRLTVNELRDIQKEGCILPRIDLRRLRECRNGKVLEYFKENNDPEGFLNFVAAVFDAGFRVDYRADDFMRCEEEDFCLRELYELNFLDDEEEW